MFDVTIEKNLILARHFNFLNSKLDAKGRKLAIKKSLAKLI